MPANCTEALGFWTIGIQYLHLVQAVSNETHQQGNTHVVVSDDNICVNEYQEQTKWSDHNLVIPLLFNFYHGLETILKGFRVAKGVTGHPTHKLTGLLTEFKTNYPRSELIPLFEKYIIQANLPTILAHFCTTSCITMDDYYQALKYPISTSGQEYHHHPLKYRESEGAAFFSELRDAIADIRSKTVTLGRSICPSVCS